MAKPLWVLELVSKSTSSAILLHVKRLLIVRVGTGLSAKCLEQGGAHLILLYNSGRFRMAGRGSLAGMMPYSDANAVVLDMVSFAYLFASYANRLWPLKVSPGG